MTQQQIANNLGINIDTLIEYKKKYVEFAEAIKKGKEVVDIEVENSLLKSAKGFYYEEEVVINKKEVIYNEDGKRLRETNEPVVISLRKYKPSDITAIIFWLKNRKPDKWRDKVLDTNSEEAINNAKEILVKIRKTVNERYDRS